MDSAWVGQDSPAKRASRQDVCGFGYKLYAPGSLKVFKFRFFMVAE